MDPLLPSQVLKLRAAAAEVAGACLAPRADEVDRECRWPEHALRALGESGLMGLHVPGRLGGQGQGLLALAVVTEALAQACSSSAMCYAMHCVGTAVIAAKATRDQEERYLRPIAQGRHVTTLALTETGTGSHFYLPETACRREGDAFLVDGSKNFITNGGHADSYVVSTASGLPDAEAGEFSCLIVDGGAPGLSWREPWRGLGMRGNSSRGLRLELARVPVANLLGEEGDQIWYVFEVVAPYFLMAMSGAYLGIAQAALDLTLRHVRARRYSHSGETLAEMPHVQHRAGQLWAAVEKSRQLIYHAARLGDLGDPQALVAIFSCKAEVADTAVTLTNEAMTLCGGIAYGENAQLARLLRDARAAHVMSPTTDMLRLWAGRSLLGLPLL